MSKPAPNALLRSGCLVGTLLAHTKKLHCSSAKSVLWRLWRYAVGLGDHPTRSLLIITLHTSPLDFPTKLESLVSGSKACVRYFSCPLQMDSVKLWAIGGNYGSEEIGMYTEQLQTLR